ncbi:MAG: NADH-quinone oxidoreductase subunit NuoE [Lachnospiraceae bacterium]|nr:NADH-quinone oxidoreductase subunit NuoE [Lachnospiraceae bacterium]
MANKKTNVPFQGTPEQEQALKAAIERLKDQGGALMPILQEAQEIYGYLPEEVQKMIAEGLNIPQEEVYGVATFYSQFTLNPKGKYKVAVCLGTACYVKGSGEVYARLAKELGIQGGECTADMRFSLEACRCVGACGLAPVIMINGEVYGRLVPNDVPKILEKYRQEA